jgi:hypothetical protein
VLTPVLPILPIVPLEFELRHSLLQCNYNVMESSRRGPPHLKGDLGLLRP